jgi:hypothetical protein
VTHLDKKNVIEMSILCELILHVDHFHSHSTRLIEFDFFVEFQMALGVKHLKPLEIKYFARL